MICDQSDLIGKSLKEARIPEKTGLIILAIKRKGRKRLSFNPSSAEVLNAGDTMIVLGKDDQVDAIKKIACDSNRTCMV